MARRQKPSRSDFDRDLLDLKKAVDLSAWERARGLAARCLKRNPNRFPVRHLAAYTAMMGDNDAKRAAALLNAALKENPNDLNALQILATLYISMGDNEAAADIAWRQLEIDPKHHSALHNLATAAPRRAIDLIPTMRDRLAEIGVTPESASVLWSALGITLDKNDEVDAALDAYTRSKRAQGRGYNAAGMIDHLASTQATYSPTYVDAHKGFGLPDDRMVFILGMPRSGSTLAERILASHPEIATCGERTELGRFMKEAAGSEAASNGVAAFASLSKTPMRKTAKRYLDAMHQCVSDRTARRWIDKSPANVFFCGAILTMFPNAKIIVTRRDATDVATSCYTRLFTVGHGFTETLDWLAHYTILQREYVRFWRDLYPDQIIELRYEDVVEDIEREARRLVAHVGLDWNPACATPHVGGELVLTGSAGQVRKPIYRSSVERWRRYGSFFDGFRETISAYEAQRGA